MIWWRRLTVVGLGTILLLWAVAVAFLLRLCGVW